MNRRKIGPAARTIILSIMGVTSGLLIALTAVIGLRATQSTSDQLTARTVPAETALQSTFIAASDAQASFLTSYQTQDPEAKAAALSAAEISDNDELTSWNRYLAVALDLKGERTLQDSYRSASAQSSRLATVIVSSAQGALTPTLIAEQSTQARRQLAAVATIESTIYEPLMRQQTTAIQRGIGGGRRDALLSFGFLAAVLALVGILLMKGARRDERSMRNEASALRLASDRADFETSLQRGLEMAPTEEDTFDILEQAVAMVTTEVPAELLLADSSLAHFRKVLSTDDNTEPVCPVATPGDCPACTSGQALLFEDSTQIDTCRFLRGGSPVWSVCVPVSIAGQTVGVMRAQGPIDEPPRSSLSTDLALVARKAGERIGAQRVLARTEEQAQSDPLTGLPNRRTFESEIARLQIGNRPYVIAFADLDHFKSINDTYGHDVGDRALRIFAQVLRDSIRPGDLLARHGGEEFVVFLPGCALIEARGIAERVRSQLAGAVGHGSVPSFTVTVGLAESETGVTLAEVISNADAAMLMAKSLGRDRVFAAGDEGEGCPPSADLVPLAGHRSATP